ncbi:MAG: hypothetical protein LUC92_04775 [Clostridiales bacterium]|nr:hypothetical protein [Clostridiales bacterium]
MTKTEKTLCHGIIHTASLGAAGVGAGLAQVPLSDNAIITPIQLTMIISLGKVFGKEIDKSTAKACLASQAASTVGKTAVQVILGWIPGVGNAANAAAAGALTEGIGWIIANEFSEKAA